MALDQEENSKEQEDERLEINGTLDDVLSISVPEPKEKK